MTAPRPGDRGLPFRPDELEGADDIRPDEAAAEARLARDIEGVAARGGVAPTPGFTERVMSAVALEPLPAPVIAAGSALRRGAAVGFLAALRDAFRVTFRGGFPAAARVQALALVLLVAIVMGGSGMATVGALGLLGDRGASPAPSRFAPRPTAEPEPTPTVTPDATREPTLSPTDSLDPAETEGPATASPKATQEPGGDGGGTAAPDRTKRPSLRPTATPDETAEPSEEPTEEPDESEAPRSTASPGPTQSRAPSPSPTPSPHSKD